MLNFADNRWHSLSQDQDGKKTQEDSARTMKIEDVQGYMFSEVNANIEDFFEEREKGRRTS